ncbi:hypothetical protein CCP3SC1AL1_1720006 [Gammaproteobacteria bacterium]
MNKDYDCKMCKYYRLEGTQETCIESLINENGNQELISDKRICMAFLEKESLI